MPWVPIPTVTTDRAWQLSTPPFIATCLMLARRNSLAWRKKCGAVKGSTQEETAVLGIDALEAFIKEIGLPTRWSEMGVTDEQVLRAAADTCFITPGCCRQMSRDEIFGILKEVM